MNKYLITKKMGYLVVNGEYVHRKIMEYHLGRKLNADETVHHRDGDITHNVLDNLFLFPSRKSHTAYHWYVKKNGYIVEEEFMEIYEGENQC